MRPTGSHKAGAKAKAYTQAQQLKKLRAAKRLQRAVRAYRVQRAFAQIVTLEDGLLEFPRPGSEAAHLLFEVGNNRNSSATLSSGALACSSCGNTCKQDKEEGARKLSGRTSSLGGTSSDDSRSRPDLEPPIIAEQQLAGCLEVCQSTLGDLCPEPWGSGDAVGAARAVLWLLGVPVLRVQELQRIYEHHKIRRKNALSKTILSFVVVQHGISDQGGPLPFSDERYEPRPLRPEGWEQVTRTAWTLRGLSLDGWAPGLVLTGGSRCCIETAERLCAVAVDDIAGAEAKPSPPTVTSTVFDVPRLPDIIDEFTRVVDAQPTLPPTRAIRALGATSLPPVLLVAGGSTVETLLACLTAGRNREEQIVSRLGGGDAVLLRSPPMCQIVGEGLDERCRSTSELWEEALLRDTWSIEHHIRGDARRGPQRCAPTVQSWQEANADDSNSIETSSGEGDTTPLEKGNSFHRSWCEYAGNPLILSHTEFSQLCERAGSIHHPMDRAVTQALRPLVKDYVLPATPRPPEELQVMPL